MSSFLKIFPRPKSKEATDRNLKGPYIPLDALDLDYSIAALVGNLSLNCKSCTRSIPSSKRKEGKTDESIHVFSGHLGVISKEIFLVYQLDLNFSEPFSYKNLQNVQIPQVTNKPLAKPTIHMARWIRLKKGRNELTVLVILSNFGVTIYSEDGSRILCSHLYSEDVPELMGRNVGATTSQILTGNGRGEIDVFDYALDGKEVISFRRTEKVQSEPIVQLCCRRTVLATGSPSGAIRVWKIRESKAYKVCCFKTPSEECVTGLGVWEGCIVATYGSGIFRIFHLRSKRLLGRVVAHSRWIGSMDILAHQGLLLTVSEDDAVLVWSLKMTEKGRSLNSASFGGSIKKNLKSKIKIIQGSKGGRRKQPKISVQLESAIPTDNMLLVGGKFVNCAGSVVALSNYGAKGIYFYSRVNSPKELNDH